jgi:hypothetical protein
MLTALAARAIVDHFAANKRVGFELTWRDVHVQTE